MVPNERGGTTYKFNYAEIAQLVERQTENLCVGGSIPSLGTKKDIPR